MPVLERFRQWLEAQKQEVLPKSPISAAIGYVQNYWEALIRYTSSGYLAIDNNVSEQHMKTSATGRNYAQFPIMRSAKRWMSRNP